MFKLPSKKIQFKNKKQLNRKIVASVIILVQILIIPLYQYIQPSKVDATNFAYVRLDNLSASTSTPLTGTACLQPQTTGSQTQVVITFPSTFNVSGTFGNWSVSTTNLPTGTVAWPAIVGPSQNASISGTTVTFAGNNLLSTSTTYCFNFSGGTAAQSNTGTTTGTLTGKFQTFSVTQPYAQYPNSPVDNYNIAESLVTGVNNTVAITATVSATLTFSLSTSSAQFPATGISTTGSGSNAAPYIMSQVSTNAHSGWTAWVKSANGGLLSPSSGGTINSAAFTAGGGNIVTLSSANSAYVLDAEPFNGNPAIPTYYNGSNTNGGNLDTKWEQVASNTGPTNGDNFNMTLRAKAAPTTPAANDYSDTIQVTAAGQF